MIWRLNKSSDFRHYHGEYLSDFGISALIYDSAHP